MTDKQATFLTNQYENVGRLIEAAEVAQKSIYKLLANPGLSLTDGILLQATTLLHGLAVGLVGVQQNQLKLLQHFYEMEGRLNG